MADMFAEVAIVGAALDKSLHYEVPASIGSVLRPGSMVSVGLGKRTATGVVLSVSEVPPVLPQEVKLRPILEAKPPEQSLPEELVALCRWISRYYFYPLGEVLSFAVPFAKPEKSAPARTGGKMVCPACPMPAAADKVGGRGREILALLDEAGAAVPLEKIRKSVPNSAYWLNKLARQGIIHIEIAEESDELSFCPTGGGGVLELTADQKRALDVMAPLIDAAAFKPLLLYGVTGSGKTEVYMRLIERAAAQGRGALVLVPEIALTTSMEVLFRERFGPLLAVWHSALAPAMRRRRWADMLAGRKTVVLGARSAVLAPVKNIGLIIVDEEHDPSYKQEDRLRYSARDVALMRGKILGVPVVLGSATPSLQTLHRWKSDQYGGVVLASRIFGRPLPEIEIVDMKREGGRGPVFSFRLREALAQVLDAGAQAMLFLNRRGYAKFYICQTCGHVLQCASCSLTLTYHKKENRLRCHYCGWERELPERCPVCGHAALFSHGFGTERVEKELMRLFPQARPVRVDRDTMNGGAKIVEALSAVRSGRCNVLLGTQMIAKGHDFPNITLVGVINADAGLQVCDFRAGENLVQLLFQVAGRAGRGEEPGRVVLQTYNPFHYTIESLLKMDYDGFCDRELQSRKLLQYPPFTRLLKFLVTAVKEDAARAAARELAGLCRQKAALLKDAGVHIAVLGPSPAAYVKLKNRYRWQVFIKSWRSSEMQDFTESVLDAVKCDPAFREAQVTVDRDPSNEF